MDQAAAVTLHVRLERRFSGGFSLSASLDADLRGGAVLVLFGPSGAGKTTILRQIAGLERPDTGVVRFGDEVWCETTRSVWQPPQSRGAAIVFQEPTLFPHLTVRDNIRYGIRHAVSIQDRIQDRIQDQIQDRIQDQIQDRIQDQIQDRIQDPILDRSRIAVAEIATMLGVAGLENRYPRALSGGEAQRVELARALATRPRLLLLDEPFAALDAPTRVRLRRDVRSLLQTTGTPAILVTHDRTEALAMGDLIAVVIDGRIRQVGAVADVFTRPHDAAVAAALGVEAVLPGRVVAVGGGLVEIAVGDLVLHAAERESIAAGADVYACIRAEDVTIETRSPGQASTRNHLAARVVAIATEGPVDRVTLDCGVALDALITRRSREEMQLAAGAQVTAAVKATAIHVVPRA